MRTGFCLPEKCGTLSAREVSRILFLNTVSGDAELHRTLKVLAESPRLDNLCFR
jgi:hypothetical protein